MVMEFKCASLDDDEHAVQCYKDQRNKFSRLKKKIACTEVFREYKKILDIAIKEEKIRILNARSLLYRANRTICWKDFLQIRNVIHDAEGIGYQLTLYISPGGENELWSANYQWCLKELKSDRGKIIAIYIYIYEPLSTVMNMIAFLDELKSSLLDLKEKHGVKFLAAWIADLPALLERDYDWIVRWMKEITTNY
ncbi:hypothetical protein OROMI_004755 [Orobanche minor]